MLTECAKQQLLDCVRLGLRNQYGEEIEPKNFEIKDDWSSLTLHEGTFTSLGLKRFYIKDPQIKVNDKNHIPYRGFMMPVMKRDVFVIQCISGDFVLLRIIGKDNHIKELESMVRKDTKLNLGMTYEEFKEANRRDLELHKRISTFQANFNKAPERFNKNGEVITSLDHFDNFEYTVVETGEQIYNIYDGEKALRMLENKIIYLEEKKMDYDYSIDSKYIEEAVDAITSLYPEEINRYFTKGGKYVFENIDEICFETELTKGQVWKAWKYMNWIDIEKEIQEIELTIKDIKKGIDVGKRSIIKRDDDLLPNLFKNLPKENIVRK